MPLMDDVTLYGLERSVYTRIARLGLEEKAVAYTLQETEIFGPDGVPAEHRIRHPFGRIPALRHGEFSLYEAGAIARYVDEAFAGPPLQPTATRERARMNQVISILDSYAYRPMVWGVFVERVSKPLAGENTNERLVEQSTAASTVVLAALSDMLGDSPYLTGDTLSLADLHAYPMLRYLALTAEGASALLVHRNLVTWMDSMQQRPSVQRTTSSFERAS